MCIMNIENRCELASRAHFVNLMSVIAAYPHYDINFAFNFLYLDLVDRNQNMQVCVRKPGN